MSIAESIAAVRKRVAAACRRVGRDPSEVSIVAVAKTKPAAAVAEAVAAGLVDIGENYVQELKAKQAELAGMPEIRWHLVGRLQRNKAKDVVGAVSLIHSVAAEPLMDALERRAEAAGLVQDVLLQVNVAGEDQKEGVAPKDVPDRLAALAARPHLRCTGLMTLPPFVDDPEENRLHFRRLRELARAHGLSQLSMGMTTDFEVAVEEGATLVRLGTAIFGER